MARKRSATPKGPWWLVALVAIGGFLYNTFLKPSSTSNPPTRSTREPREQSTPKSTRTKKPTVNAAGGVPTRDVVIKVSDGDTIKLEKGGSIRLIGVDCPEKAQDGGTEATEFASRALLNKTIEVELCAKQPTDRYGRGLGTVFIQSNGRRINFNAELVRQGYARVYSLRPCTVDETEWNGYYEEARQARRGLFRTMNEVPDAATYRRNKRSKSSADFTSSRQLLVDAPIPSGACG